VIADWIDDELQNWARWCNSGPWPHPVPPDHAASAEGRYLSPSDIDAEPEPRPVRPNAERAEIVHRVYRERLTDRERRVLVVRYIHRTPADQVPRRTRLSEALVAEATMAAARLIGEEFREERLALRA
jgi:DNA-directed RNA polymerase specialized sigma subunit